MIGYRSLRYWCLSDLEQDTNHASICIVGGSDQWDSDKAISDTDPISDDPSFVVRINNHWIRQGGPCDILFGCGLETLPDGYDPSYGLVFPFDSKLREYYEERSVEGRFRLGNWEQKRFAKPNPRHPAYEYMNRFNHTIGTMPLTGIAAINYFIHLPVRSIFVTGMTLYLDGGHEIRRTASGEQQRWRDSHWIDPQVRWLKHLLTIDPRVTVDERLEELLARENCINGYTMSQV